MVMFSLWAALLVCAVQTWVSVFTLVRMPQAPVYRAVDLVMLCLAAPATVELAKLLLMLRSAH